MKSIKNIINKIFLICIVCFYTTVSTNGNNLSYLNSSKNLMVTLNYWQQINDFLAYNEKLPKDCKIENTINKRIIICPAWVKILITEKQLLNWQQEQKKNGFINLYLPKIGTLHEQAKIAKIKKITQQSPTSKNQHLVTAVYMRYAHVLKYKIKDINTGKIGEITATPEHKFYETTYKKFIAISKLGSRNTITNASNHYLKIICTNNRQNNCGTAPLNSLQKVYNIEVEKAHNYFVGNMKTLVHNGCYDYYYRCIMCKETHAERDYFIKKCEKSVDKGHDVKKFYQCEFCGITNTRQKTILLHKKTHLKTPNRTICSFCSITLKNPHAMVSHARMHSRDNYTIFCRKCDEFISLKSKLNKSHRHPLSLYPSSELIALGERISSMTITELYEQQLPDSRIITEQIDSLAADLNELELPSDTNESELPNIADLQIN